MCGIAGILLNKDCNCDISKPISTMAASLAHRGPDESGSYSSKNVNLFHTRLSIIDLSKNACQPMSNEDNSIWLICNGEIYNYKEIRKELINKGHQFKSHSDNEVIIHLYEEKGELLLEDLRGMFAFCVWDSRNRALFVARDKLGIKQLYYYWDNSIFIFASEIKAIANSGLIPKELNNKAIILYLKFGSIPSSETIYKHIISLEPAHYLILKNEHLKKKRYWSLTDCFLRDKLNLSSEQEAVSLLREHLKDSVEKHLISDVQVGVFLSGGIDSSSIVSLVRDVSNSPVKTISVGFPDTEYDESRFAKKVSDRFSTEHMEVEIHKHDLKSRINDFFDRMDQPTVDGLNTYLVSWAAKQAGLKVCLSGLGGDELFAGYRSFRQIPRIYSLLRIGDFLKLPKQLLFFGSHFYSDGKINRIADMFDPKLSFNNVYLNYRCLFSKKELMQVLNEDILNSLEDNPRFTDYAPHISELKCSINKVCLLETSLYMTNQLLRDTDVFSMCWPVEVRVPFVDSKLIEILARIPPRLRCDINKPKKLLIDTMNNLPPEIVNRRKMGFTLPIDLWIKDVLKEFIEGNLFSSGILNRKYLNLIYKQYQNNKLHWSKLWALVVLNIFSRKV